MTIWSEMHGSICRIGDLFGYKIRVKYEKDLDSLRYENGKLIGVKPFRLKMHKLEEEYLEKYKGATHNDKIL